MGFFQDVGNAISGVFKGGGGGGGGRNNNNNAAAAQQQAQMEAMQRLIAAQKAAAAAAAAAEAERIRQESIRRENERAQSAMDKSFTAARSQLGQQNALQSTADASALQRTSAANLSAGASATGAGASPNLKTSTAATYGVTGVSPTMAVPANAPAAAAYSSTNEKTGNTPGRSNQFQTPNVKGLTFGGA
jgi:hypothetical protein